MNTYDFDKTIFWPDSSYTFVMFCLRRFPAAWRTLPRTALLALRHLRGNLRSKELKEQIFSFLAFIPDIDGTVREFWRLNRSRLQPWYLRQKRDDDIIISASPEFLLRPICESLGVRLIGTRMDSGTGHIDGENCHDSEKVRRFYEAFPGAHTEAFYSDSLSDSPMAAIADSAFMVKKGSLSPWPGK